MEKTENFYLVSKLVNNYEETNCKGIQQYIYKDLNNSSFYTDFYLENEKSMIATTKLETALMAIIADELSIDEILSYILFGLCKKIKECKIEVLS
ncbi:hypothetical protein [Anaerosporobacter sp.]|uniref:hypothetical protein n=1 Tax=Anaerosporobacter sp. TaxID=1872529 RepID=UPI00286F10E6|nr:hypothetical protein [Anaerosporobacter sp.]